MGYGRRQIRNSMPPRYPLRTELERGGAATRMATVLRKGNVGFQTSRRLPALVRTGVDEGLDHKLAQMLALAPSTGGMFADKKWKSNPAIAAGPRLTVMYGGKKQNDE